MPSSDCLIALTNSHLTCDPPFSIADIAESESLVEACADIAKRITQIIPDLNITATYLHYIDPTIPSQLLAIDIYAHFFETQHGCHIPHPEKTHCTWASQLRGEITQLFARMGGQNDPGGLDNLITILSESNQALSELQQITTEYLALESSDTGHALSVLSVLSERHDRFRDLIGQAEGLAAGLDDPQHGLPAVCDLFKRIREVREGLGRMLAKGRFSNEAWKGGKDEV